MVAAGLIGAVGGWLAKDLAGRFLGRIVARAGRIGYAFRQCGFYAESVADDGTRSVGRYYPNNMFVDDTIHYLRCGGDLYNDSAVPVLFNKASVMFWAPAGPTIRHADPHIFVDGKEQAVVTVPAHGRQTITFSLPVFRDDLDTKYASTLPVLTLETVNGRKHEFRLSPVSFHGPLAAWPRKGKLPILLVGGARIEAEADESLRLDAGDSSVQTIRDDDRDAAV